LIYPRVEAQGYCESTVLNMKNCLYKYAIAVRAKRKALIKDENDHAIF